MTRHEDRPRKSKKADASTIFWIVVVVVGFLIFKNSGGNKVKQQRASKAAPAFPAPPPRAAGMAAYDWPRPAPDGKTPELADDLTMRNYYVILDGSGSMRDSNCSGGTNKMRAAKRALSEFSAAVPANTQLGLLAFDQEGTTERVPLGRGNRDSFSQAVHRVQSNGSTPLKTAISIGVSKLEEQARRQLGYGEYHLVVVTDGEASLNEDPRDVVAELLGRAPVILHTIGFCIGADHSLNQPGRTLYKAADSPAELESGLSEVLAEAEEFDVSDFNNL